MQYGELAAAARAGDVARVRALLAAGADPIPSLPDDNWVYAQFAPLWAAVDGGSIECVRALLDAGAGLQLRDLDPRMPILTRATSVAMVDLLLDAGADPWLKPHTSDSVA